MDHNKHIRLTSTEPTADILKGATIYGADDHAWRPSASVVPSQDGLRAAP